MTILCACDLSGCAVWVWDKDDWIRWPGECIGRHDATILCGCEDHAQVDMISASHGGWD